MQFEKKEIRTRQMGGGVRGEAGLRAHCAIPDFNM